MIVKAGDKLSKIIDKTEFQLRRSKEIYQVECITIFACYLPKKTGKESNSPKRNLFSKNYKKIPLDKNEIDLYEEIDDFNFIFKRKNPEDELKYNKILGYKLYYANLKNSKYSPTEPESMFWISEEEIKRLTNNNNIYNTTHNKNNYLPTREDCEKAYKKLSELNKDIPIDELFSQLEKDVIARGKFLHPDWLSITKNNLKQWDSEDRID